MPGLTYLAMHGVHLQPWQGYVLIGVLIVTILIAVVIIRDIRTM